MKILLIHSSYRTDGNTSRVINLFEEELRELSQKRNLDIQIEKIALAHSEIKMCRGCRICFDKGEEQCPLKDDLLQIRDKMLQADAYVFASPVYVEDINGVMKNWIDRMAFNSHRPAFYGKNVYLLSTSGIGSSNHSLKTMNTAFNTWAMNVAGRMKFRLGALTQTDEIRTMYHENIHIAANKLVKSLKDCSAEKPSLYSLIAFTVQQRYWQKNKKYQLTYDYQYWERENWLSKGCTYYFKHKSSMWKTFLARLFGKVVAIFFI
jgi:multimeric flavodoxin WrbA